MTVHFASTRSLPCTGPELREQEQNHLAAIYLCRKFGVLPGKPSPVREMAFPDSMELAEELMRRIDSAHASGRN
jgi:hypothetical protein